MCGLIGVISKKHIPDFERDYLEPLERALDKMEYRGPDNKGIWHENGICFGHRRLSIIDLSVDGNQPFRDPDGRFIIVFNGEIYNYRELKAELIKLGYSFNTETDTEVILTAYLHYGSAFCESLRGMFALVIYDRAHSKIIFARDRLGKKPLFIYENKELIIFSSEIKFFHAFPVTLAIDEDSLLNFLSLQYIPGPATIYQNVRQLPPAGMYIYDQAKDKGTERSYWNIFSYAGGGDTIPEIDEIDALLAESVRYRLVANVDVGLLLSGGIDSSLLACYMSELADKKVRAFNVGFSDKQLDESDYARKVAGALGMELVSLNLEDISPDNFTGAVYHADQPLGDSAIIPTYLIAKSIGQQVKVVLSGEGADELFHGYDHYRYESYYYGMGGAAMKAAGYLLGFLPSTGISPFGKLKNKLKSIRSFRHDTGVSRWTSVLSPEMMKKYLHPPKFSGTRSYESLFNHYLDSFGINAGKLESSLMLDLVTWLPDDLLVKTDRMMMARSVEARTPFLDHELVQKVLMASAHFDDPLFQSKNYLRRLLKKRLPSSVAETISGRKKQGFETPKVTWLNSNLSELSSFLFSAENLNSNPFLDSPAVQKLWGNFKRQSPGVNNRLVWNIFCFLEWYRQHNSKFGFGK